MSGHSHSHTHFHGHAAHGASTGKVLIVSLVLTVAFVMGETAAGLWSHSLALLSDAGHNFTDAFGLGLAAVAYYVEARPGDHIKTFGYQRTGVLAAFVNALTLVLLCAALFWESYRRLVNPEPVASGVMIGVATVGLLLNLGIAWGLGGHGTDLNVRAAWLHMIGDAASCVAIIVGAIAIRYTGWTVIDPLLSILIGIVIVWTAWDIFKDSLNILLEGLPKGLSLAEVNAELRGIPGVIDVHDLHIWCLGSDARALSCHVLIEDMPPSSSNSILQRITHVLNDHFAIHHSTIQFEHMRCELADSGCVPARSSNHL